MLLAILLPALAFQTPSTSETPSGRPDATIDLTSDGGVALVGGAWRVHPAHLVEVDFRAAGPDRKPSGPPNRTLGVEPAAGARDFDDSGWEELEAAHLDRRLGDGRVSFVWYRMRVTVPARVGDLDPTGATVVLDTVVDDYAEVWVDGELRHEIGQRGGSVVAGWNAPNRLVVGRGVLPGQVIQLAIFGINAPLSDPPPNFIWMRSARLDFYGEPRAERWPVAVETTVERLSPRLDEVVSRDARIERLATGFAFTEGPLWLPEGALLFSDPNRNRIYRWSPSEGLAVFRERSGYQGADVGEYGQPGSNGLALDPEGRLTVCEHGNRCISRTEPDGTRIVLAERYEGRRLNSPNDLVYRSDGTLYFSDPPFGLPRFHDDPRRELRVTGVYRLREGVLHLETAELSGPNGLAFSPDERFLYVTNWDEERKVVMRHEVGADGSLGPGEVFFDMGGAPEAEALDGVKVDREGNLFVSGPGGLWVLSRDGEHLGTIRGPELPANLAWGDPDGRTLYLTARHGLYRMRVATGGRAVALARNANSPFASKE